MKIHTYEDLGKSRVGSDRQSCNTAIDQEQTAVRKRDLEGLRSLINEVRIEPPGGFDSDTLALGTQLMREGIGIFLGKHGAGFPEVKPLTKNLQFRKSSISFEHVIRASVLEPPVGGWSSISRQIQVVPVETWPSAGSVWFAKVDILMNGIEQILG